MASSCLAPHQWQPDPRVPSTEAVLWHRHYLGWPRTYPCEATPRSDPQSGLCSQCSAPSHHPARNIAGSRLPTKSQCLAPRPCLPPRRPAHPQVPPPSRASSLRGPTPCHPSSPHMGPLRVPTVCGVQAHLEFRGGGQPGAFWGSSLVAPAPRGQGGGESCWGEGLPVSGDSDLRAELLREQGPWTELPS